jgi:parallel beta-helix repeat protein
VVYVNCDASGSSADGKSWSTAFRTVQEGIDAAAQGEGSQVWVAAGTYTELIYLKEGVLLYGGFAGTEGSLAHRDWERNVTVLDGNRQGTVVEVQSLYAGGMTTRIDGFTIQNGLDTSDVTGNICGGGIECRNDDDGALTIENNTITNNMAEFGGGIYLLYASSTVRHNTISGNRSGWENTRGGGICCGRGGPRILNNRILANRSSGIFASAFARGSGLIANNVISDNEDGLFLYWPSVIPDVVSNTMVRNAGAGVFITWAEGTRVANNIIAFNHAGVGTTGEQPELINNCVYWNRDEDYGSDIQPGVGDFSADPKFEADGYHLKSSSPCINAGSNTPVGWDDDIDGEPRIYRSGGVVDVGADEYQGSGGHTVPSDVGVTDVIYPAGEVDSGWVETPSAKVRNFSSHPLGVVFPVTMRIGSLYEETVQETIAGRDTLTVFFPDWTASAGGMQPIVCFTHLALDGNTANDTAYDSVYVRPAGHGPGMAGSRGAGYWWAW